MDNLLTQYLKSSGSYTAKELTLFENAVQLKTLEKDELLLKEGEVCSTIFFIVSGAICQYKIDSELDRIVIDLNTSNDWVLNHKSFTSQQPSECYIQAFEKTSVYSLSIESLHFLIAQSQSFLQMGRILEEATSRIVFFDNYSTPDDKYQYLLKNKPYLIQKFPQNMIASYLKMTPETLSRVRKRLSKS